MTDTIHSLDTHLKAAAKAEFDKRWLDLFDDFSAMLQGVAGVDAARVVEAWKVSPDGEKLREIGQTVHYGDFLRKVIDALAASATKKERGALILGSTALSSYQSRKAAP